jgi:hypothetical protein
MEPLLISNVETGSYVARLATSGKRLPLRNDLHLVNQSAGEAEGEQPVLPVNSSVNSRPDLHKVVLEPTPVFDRAYQNPTVLCR